MLVSVSLCDEEPCHLLTGTMETAIHFVIYEHLKKEIRYRRSDAELDLSDCMIAAGIAKLTASSLCYPHGKCVRLCLCPL